MAIANPRIHIICGICGCNKEFKYFTQDEFYFDDNGEQIDCKYIYIICENCGSLTSLDELIKERNSYEYIEFI